MSRKRRSQLEQRRVVVRLVHERDTDCVFMATAWGLRGHTELLDGDLTLFPGQCAGPAAAMRLGLLANSWDAHKFSNGERVR